MRQYEMGVRIAQVHHLIEERKYKKALAVIETLDIRQIRGLSDLSAIAEVYSRTGHFAEALDTFTRIYRKSKTKRVLQRIIFLAIRTGDLEDAEEYYQEFADMNPSNRDLLTLRYRIDKASGVPIGQLIEVLEALKEEEYVEEWAYELAKLYHSAGRYEDCRNECDDIITWFGYGEIVEHAKRLIEYVDDRDTMPFMDDKDFTVEKEEPNPEDTGSLPALDEYLEEEKQRKKQVKERAEQIKHEVKERRKFSKHEKDDNESDFDDINFDNDFMDDFRVEVPEEEKMQQKEPWENTDTIQNEKSMARKDKRDKGNEGHQEKTKHKVPEKSKAEAIPPQIIYTQPSQSGLGITQDLAKEISAIVAAENGEQLEEKEISVISDVQNASDLFGNQDVDGVGDSNDLATNVVERMKKAARATELRKQPSPIGFEEIQDRDKMQQGTAGELQSETDKETQSESNEKQSDLVQETEGNEQFETNGEQEVLRKDTEEETQLEPNGETNEALEKEESIQSGEAVEEDKEVLEQALMEEEQTEASVEQEELVQETEEEAQPEPSEEQEELVQGTEEETQTEPNGETNEALDKEDLEQSGETGEEDNEVLEQVLEEEQTETSVEQKELVQDTEEEAQPEASEEQEELVQGTEEETQPEPNGETNEALDKEDLEQSGESEKEDKEVLEQALFDEAQTQTEDWETHKKVSDIDWASLRPEDMFMSSAEVLAFDEKKKQEKNKKSAVENDNEDNGSKDGYKKDNKEIKKVDDDLPEAYLDIPGLSLDDGKEKQAEKEKELEFTKAVLEHQKGQVKIVAEDENKVLADEDLPTTRALHHSFNDVLTLIGGELDASHFVLMGDGIERIVGISKKIIKVVKESGFLSHGRIARINAKQLNEMDLISFKEQLEGNCLLVDEASELLFPTITRIFSVMDEFANDFVVILADEGKTLDQLFRFAPALAKRFKYIIDISQYTEDDYRDE